MKRRDLLKLAVSAPAAAATASLAQSETPPPEKEKPAATPGEEKRPNPLRILILGGTGFTGPYQVKYALGRGHKLTLFNRGRRPTDWPAEVEEFTGDREKGDLKALEDREWDVCIDNPTSVPFWVRDAAKTLAGKVKHYIFISTISVYSDTSKKGMDEETPTAVYTGKDAMAETMASLRADMTLYGPLKAECERVAQKEFPEITTVIRPTLIAGPGDDSDRFTYWPVRIARGGEVLAPPREDPVQYIDARDLAEWTVRVAEQRALGVFNACGPLTELTVAEMFRGIQAAVKTEATPVFATGEFLEKQSIAPWGDLPAWVPGQGETAGFATVSNARAVKAGMTYRPLGDTARDTLDWFNALPHERRKKLRAGLSSEREAAALKAWHAKE